MAIDEDSTIFKNFSHTLDVKRAQKQIDENKKNVDRTAYDVYDSEGNRIGGAYLKPGESISKGDEVYVNRETGEVAKNIKDSLGGLPAAKAAATIDKSGKITVEAPQSLIDNPALKQNFDDVLKTISTNYKKNADYKYALLDGEEAKTSEEWLEKINEDLQKLAETERSYEDLRETLKQENGVELSNDQIRKRLAVAAEYQDATGQTVKIKDTDMQSLPERIRNMNVFNNLEGYDEENHVVSFGDLKNVWTRKGVGGDNSDSNFRDVYNEVSEYFANGDFSDADEYAEMAAFREFMMKNDPEAGFWQGLGDLVKMAGTGVATGAATFTGKALSALEMGTPLGAAETVESLIFKTDNIKRAAEEASYNLTKWMPGGGSKDLLAGNFIDNYLLPELDSWKEDFTSSREYMSNVSLGAYSLVDTVEPILMQIAIGNAFGEAVATGAATSMLTKAKAVERVSFQTFINASSNTMEAIGESEKIAESLYNGTKVMLSLQTTAKANQTISGAIKALSAVNKAGGIVKGISTAADLIAETTVDVVLTDPTLLRNFLSGDGSEEEKAYMLEQVSGNIVGWGAFTLAGKGIKAFAGTRIGVIANAALARKTTGFGNWISRRGQDIRNLLHKGDAEEWLAKKIKELDTKIKTSDVKSQKDINKLRDLKQKQQALKTKEMLVGAREKVNEAYRSSEEFKDLYEKSSSYLNDIRLKSAEALAAAEDMFNANAADKISEIMLDNTTLKAARDDMFPSIKNVLRAEDAAGITRGGKLYDLGNLGKVEVISTDSNRYINAKFRLGVLNVAEEIEKDGNILKAIKEEKSYWENATKAFTESNSPELISACDDLLEKIKKFSYELQDMKANPRYAVMNADELADMRNAEHFKDGYMRTQRIKDYTPAERGGGSIKRKATWEHQDLKYGSTDEFQDVVAVQFEDLNNAAKNIISNDIRAALEGLGQKVEVVVSGDDVRIANIVNPKKEKAKKDVTNAIRNFTKDGLSEEYFQKFVKEKKAGEILLARHEGKVAKSEARAAKEAAKALEPASNMAVKRFINSVDGRAAASAILEGHLGKSLTELTEDDFNNLVKGLSNRAKSELSNEIYSALGGEEFITKVKDLPEIRTSDYESVTGNKYKDAPKNIKRHLNKNGVSIDDDSIRELMSAENYLGGERVGGGAAQYTADDVLAFYDLVTTRKAPGLNYDDFMETLGNADSYSNISNSIVRANYDNIFDSEKAIGEGETLRKVVAEEARDKKVFELNTIFKENQARLDKFKQVYNLEQIEEDLVAEFDDMVDGVIESASKSEQVTKTLEALGEGEDAIEYMVLNEMSSNLNKKPKDGGKTLKQKYQKAAEGRYKDILTTGEIAKSKDEIADMSKKWAKESADWFEEHLQYRLDEIEGKLAESGSEILNKESYFKKVDDINDQIKGAKSDPAIIKTFNADGVEEYVRIDPVIADMIKNMPPALQRTRFGEIRNNICKIFRFGTTGGLVPGSLVRQAFKDTGNALVAGNAFLGEAELVEKLSAEMGEEIAQYFKQMPDVWTDLLRRSSGDTGDAVKLGIRENIFEKGRIGVEEGLESQLYKYGQQERFARDANGVYTQKQISKWKELSEKAYENTETLNNMREKMLRQRVYTNAIYDNMKNGMSLQNAMKYAEFMKKEATTNFSRLSYHFSSMAQSVPYLGAALNGSKSFWRLYALDPVGITNRIIGGYVVPMVALTNMTLSDPESKRIYKQIPEWQKAGHLTVVIHGQIMQIPVPEEVGRVIRPFQSILEKMQDINEKDFNELMLNDVLGFSPLNMEGFVNIDRDRILKEDVENTLDANIKSHLIPGISKLMSGMLPPVEKSAVMYVTGFDPYTMKQIDRNRTAVDSETGEQIIVDYESGELAKFLAKITGGTVSAPMAQAFLKNLIGKNNTYIMDAIAGLTKAVVDEDTKAGEVLTEFAEKEIGDQVVGEIMTSRYGEESNLAWNRAVSKLYQRKAEVQKEIAEDVKAINRGNLSREAEEKARARVNQKMDSYAQEVLAATQNLISQYDGTFDRNKFSATVALMNFYDESTASIADSAMARSDRKDISNDAYAQALQTMQEYGFTSSNDYSILGYYKQNNDGTVEVKYNSPLSILNFQQTKQYQNRYHEAAIKEIFNSKDESGKNWYDRHQDVKNEISAYTSAKDYDKADELRIQWDNEVIKALAPYISQMSPEAVIGNEDMLALIGKYIEVPSSFEKNGKRYVSLGQYGNKKDAYVDSWIKGMFGVADKYKGEAYRELNEELKEKYGLRDYNE